MLTTDLAQLNILGLFTFTGNCRHIQSGAHLFRVTLAGSIDCKSLLKRALDQYRSEAMDAALDLESLTAVVEGDYLQVGESTTATNHHRRTGG